MSDTVSHTQTRDILILGATGGIGGTLARTLLRRGWRVRALVRNPDAAPRLDRRRRAGMDRRRRHECARRAGSGTRHRRHPARGQPAGYRRWGELVLPMLDNTIAAARATGARVVLPGTIYNYDAADTPLINEATPQTARGAKGRIRIEMERRLAAAAPEVKSLIVRAGDFFGPDVTQSWFAQVLAKPPLTAIMDPGRPGIGHGWAYVPDLAETMAQLLERAALAPAERVQFEGFWDADGTGMADAIRGWRASPTCGASPSLVADAAAGAVRRLPARGDGGAAALAPSGAAGQCPPRHPAGRGAAHAAGRGGGRRAGPP